MLRIGVRIKMAKSLIQESAANLKKAVPLMLQYNIPTTPTNYALWYTYVADNTPELNQQLDSIVTKYETCPPSLSAQLYRGYITDPIEVDVLEMRQNLAAMTLDLSQTLTDTNRDAAHFQNRIDANFAKIDDIDQSGLSLEKVLGLVREIAKESDSIRSSTDYFTRQLNKAQQEINRLKEQLKTSEQAVLHDALTQVYNRRAFDTDLTAILNQSPEGCCLILIDLDHFKDFNDTYGHQLGDQVLKAVAKRLASSCRDGANIYRYGGEEFAVIIAKSHLRSARHLAEGMRRSLEKISIKERKKGQMINNITASFGVAQWQKKLDYGSLIEEADQLLYKAKNLGRNRVMPIIK